MKKAIMFFVMVFCVNILFAQHVLTGKVTDDQKQPLPGVSVYEKGTTRGVTSDITPVRRRSRRSLDSRAVRRQTTNLTLDGVSVGADWEVDRTSEGNCLVRTSTIGDCIERTCNYRTTLVNK